jgi:hypothetical protein
MKDTKRSRREERGKGRRKLELFAIKFLGAP